MNKKTHLLAIDPQYDFCNPKGALVVPRADEDMKRLAEMVNRMKDGLDDIHITMDSHRTIHIAHPIFWVDKDGKHPNPFTVISHDDVKNGVWHSYNPALQQKASDYTKTLEDNGRYVLCIWRPHCLIGSQGHSIDANVFEAITEWENQFAMIDYVTKGSNPFTEHYSAVKADVEDPSDPTTRLNGNLLDSLLEADDILITGEALSHCVANTVRDIADNFGDENIKKFVLIEDTTSNVATFESLGEDFVKEMMARGMRTAKSTDF